MWCYKACRCDAPDQSPDQQEQAAAGPMENTRAPLAADLKGLSSQLVLSVSNVFP